MTTPTDKGFLMDERLSYKPLLRTIGQVLDALEVDGFDLTIAGDQFIITAQSPSPQSSWHRFRRRFVKPSTAQAGETLTEFRYTLADLEELELEYRQLAVDGSRVPDRRSLPQVLRIVGAYVDEKLGELLSVTRHNPSFVITYLNSAGEKLTEDLLYLDVDGLFVRELGLRHEAGKESRGAEQNAETAEIPAAPGNLIKQLS
jgi:hypothetical protein